MTLRKGWLTHREYFENETHGDKCQVSPSRHCIWKSSLNEYWLTYHQKRASQVALGVKNPPANAGDIRHIGSIPQSGRSLKKGMATHSGILAWRISWTEKPSGLQFMGSQRARHDWGQSACMQQSVSSTELLLWFILLPYSDSRLTRGFWMSAFHAGKEC